MGKQIKVEIDGSKVSITQVSTSATGLREIVTNSFTIDEAQEIERQIHCAVADINHGYASVATGSEWSSLDDESVAVVTASHHELVEFNLHTADGKVEKGVMDIVLFNSQFVTA